MRPLLLMRDGLAFRHFGFDDPLVGSVHVRLRVVFPIFIEQISRKVIKTVADTEQNVFAGPARIVSLLLSQFSLCLHDIATLFVIFRVHAANMPSAIVIDDGETFVGHSCICTEILGSLRVVGR